MTLKGTYVFSTFGPFSVDFCFFLFWPEKWRCTCWSSLAIVTSLFAKLFWLETSLLKVCIARTSVDIQETCLPFPDVFRNYGSSYLLNNFAKSFRSREKMKLEFVSLHIFLYWPQLSNQTTEKFSRNQSFCLKVWLRQFFHFFRKHLQYLKIVLVLMWEILRKYI